SSVRSTGPSASAATRRPTGCGRTASHCRATRRSPTPRWTPSARRSPRTAAEPEAERVRGESVDESVIDRWMPLRFVFVAVLLFTPFWRSYAARLPWLYLVVLACALAFFATPLVRGVARWWGVLDLPGERKVHATATPLLGGTAVYGAFAVTVLANFDFSRGLKG